MATIEKSRRRTHPLQAAPDRSPREPTIPQPGLLSGGGMPWWEIGGKIMRGVGSFFGGSEPSKDRKVHMTTRRRRKTTWTRCSQGPRPGSAWGALGEAQR